MDIDLTKLEQRTAVCFLLHGDMVIFKPSEVAPLIERLRSIQRLIDQWEHDPTASKTTVLGEIAALVK